MSKRLEEHLLRAEVIIREVLLRGTHTGRLAFSLKCDELALSRQKEKHPLQDDRCLPFQRFEFQCLSEFETVTNSYRPKQISIALHLETDGGNSVVGTVRLNLLQSGLAERRWELPIDGSPAGSKMILQTKSELITKKPQQSRDILISDPYNLAKSKRPDQNDRRASAINELMGKDSKLSPKDSLYNDKNSDRQRFFNKTKRVESVKNIQIDNKKGFGSGKAFSPRSTIHEVSEKTKPFDQMDNLKRKIEEERAEKVRSISKLKMEMSPRLMIGDPLHEDDSEMSKMREKIRNLERKERNYEITIEELGNEIEKRKVKQGQLEKQKEELERALGEKQIKFRSAQATIRNLTEQLESSNNKERVVSKKGEAKENILKDQMKRLEDRLKEAEEESIKAMNEKNEVIKNVAELEKKHQLALKERESRIIEEKNKHQKSKDEWSKLDRDYCNIINDLNNKIEDLNKEKKAADQRTAELEGLIFKSLGEIQELKDTLKQERQNWKLREEEHDKIQGTEISTIRKKVNELTTESVNNRQKIKRLQGLKTDHQAKIKELEDNLKGKNGELSKANNRITSLKKEVEGMLDEISRRAKESDNLRQTINTLNNKFAETKDKADGEKIRRQESNRELEKQNILFAKQRENLQGQIQQLKWVIVRNNDKIAETQYETKQMNNTILKLNSELIAKSQRITSLEEKITQLQIDYDRLAKEKGAYELKSRELMESFKIKMMEHEEEKRMRLRADQKSQEERERANQYINSYKEREAQEELKQKEKEEHFKRKLEEITTLQLEVAKKNEDISTLKNGNEMILREVHLSKMQTEAIKNELQFVESDRNTLKAQVNQLQSLIKSLESDLTNSKQGTIFQTKRYDSLRKEFDEYKMNVEKALENLSSEFSRQDETHNVIATTLLPFPDKKLSTFQIDIVQKRNNFIVRQRQKMAELHNQNTLFGNQLKDMKLLFENREIQTKKQENEERERLKSLLYENMMQKNALIEQLNREKQQLEQICRQSQKLKAQILMKLDNEQQLNGQLQILLLQYDSLKAQNQQLTNHVYRYKQAEIKTKGDYQQKLLQLQDDNAVLIQKLKLQLNEKEKRMIGLEKELMEGSDKIRKIDDERHRLQEENDQLGEKIKQLDNINSNTNLDITKLNNVIKNNEKKQAQMKELIDRMDNDFKQLMTKNEQLQQNQTKIQGEFAEISIQKEKLTSELANAHDRISQLDKMLHQRGETTKQKIQKKMQENSQLKNKLVEKESDLSLKDFFLKQKEQQNALLLEQQDEMKKSIFAYKAKIKELVELQESNEIKIRDLTRDLDQAEHDREQKEDLISRCNFAVFSLQSELEEAHKLQGSIDAKEKECIRLRQEKNEIEQYYIGELKKHRESLIAVKRELANEKDINEKTAQQYQLNLKKSQMNNTEKYNYLQGEFEREKEEFYRRVEEIEEHNKKIIGQLEYRIDKAREEHQQAKELEKTLKDELYKKDNVIITLRRRIDGAEKEGEQNKQKYNRYYLLYEECKAEMENLLQDQHDNVINAVNQAKNALQKQIANRHAELLRKIERLRHNQEMDLKAEPLSRREIKSLLDRLFTKMLELLNEVEPRDGPEHGDFKQSRS